MAASTAGTQVDPMTGHKGLAVAWQDKVEGGLVQSEM